MGYYFRDNFSPPPSWYEPEDRSEDLSSEARSAEYDDPIEDEDPHIDPDSLLTRHELDERRARNPHYHYPSFEDNDD